MAFGTKYRIEFKDIKGLYWKILIQVDPDPGSITDLVATGDPLRFEFNADSDEYNDPIKTSKAVVNVWSQTDFALTDLYADEDFYYKVLIYNGAAGTNLYWSGFVVTGEYSEPYDCPPYPVQITAIDGLSYLKNMLYKYETATPDDTYYNGRILESQIILDILGKIQITSFTEYVNIYESTMLSTVDDSPMCQLKLDADVFKDMYCDEVLFHILSKYNAVIRWANGGIVIYRPEELVQATVYGRIFTAATTKTSTSFTPLQYINRSTNASDLRQMPGSVLMVKCPMKKLTLKQDYGSKESWLDNWKFEAKKFVYTFPTSWTCESWSVAISPPFPITYMLPSEGDGIFIAPGNTYATLDHYVYQQFGTHIITCAATELFGFEFEYQWISREGATRNSQYFYFTVYNVATTKYLHTGSDATYAVWSASATPMSIIANVADGDSGWVSWKRIIQGIEADGPYIIRFYNTSDLYLIGMGIKNVRIFATSDEIITKKVPNTWMSWFNGKLKWYGFTKWKNKTIIKDNDEIVAKEYIVTNALTGKEAEYDYILGDVADVNIDNSIEQFAGSLAVVLRDSLTDAAANFVTDHAADYAGITVTSSAEDIIFTGNDNTNFTGNTTITNTDGDLTGSVAHTQTFATIKTITLSGDSGAIDILCNGVTRGCAFDVTLGNTCDAFVDENYAAYLAVGATLTTDSSTKLIFTLSSVSGATTATPAFPNLAGSVATTYRQRIDTITLSSATGDAGTADILCDGVTEEVVIVESLDYSEVWNTRSPGGEADPILEIIGGEMGNQYSRPKRFIQMEIQELLSTGISLNMIGRFEDDLNTISGNNRKFVFNAGSLNVKPRLWDCDLCEIIE